MGGPAEEGVLWRRPPAERGLRRRGLRRRRVSCGGKCKYTKSRNQNFQNKQTELLLLGPLESGSEPLQIGLLLGALWAQSASNWPTSLGVFATSILDGWPSSNCFVPGLTLTHIDVLSNILLVANVLCLPLLAWNHLWLTELHRFRH